MRALDQAIKEYNKRKTILGIPGWILAVISIMVIFTGILADIKAIIAIGILFIALAVFFVIMARLAQKTLMRK